jgi:type II secretory pathway component PulF
MPSYAVSYITPQGKRVDRVYDAVDADALRQQFQGKLVTALRITPHEGKRYNPKKLTVGTAMLVANFDVIEVLLDSGVPIQLALRKLVEGLPPGPVRFLWSSIASHIEGATGELAPAFAQFPRVFSTAVVGMVQSGAVTGNLAGGLREARDYIESMHELRKLAVKAMTYPAVVLFIALCIFCFLMFFTVPTFQAMLADFTAGSSKKLPVITRMFFNIADAMNHHPLLCLAGVVGVVVAGIAVIRVPSLKRFWFALWMKTPVVRDAMWALSTARFATNFASCYKATGQAMQSLEATRLVVGNPVVIEKIDQVLAEIRNGRRLGESMRLAGGFPVPIVVAVENGEADLARVLRRMGNFYANEAKRAVTGMMALLEPILTVGVVVFAGFAILALFMPLISIIRSIK